MGKIVYVTGGARSGKSSFAEDFVKNLEGYEKVYVATAVPFDDEMKERVKKHKKQRGEEWITLEGYRNLDEDLYSVLAKEKKYVILLDCLTNMVNNLMFDTVGIDWEKASQVDADMIEIEIKQEVIKFLNFVNSNDIVAVIVSNEVGMGIVPEYPLARYFRDIAGRMNQIVANYSKEAYLVVSGMKLKIK